jgi:hypothetical protein
MPLLPDKYKRTPSGVLPIVVVFIGPRWAGKTTLAAKMIPQMVADSSQIEAAGFGSPSIADKLGVPWHQLSAVTQKKQEEAADYFRAVEKRSDEFLFVLDDSDAAWPNLTSRFVALAEFIRNNRSYGQGAVIMCHGPGDVSKSILRNAQLTFWSCQSEANSIDYVRRYMKADFPLAEQRIRSLPAYTFLIWAPELPGKEKYVGECWVKNGVIQFAPRNQQAIESESTDQAEAPKSFEPDSTIPTGDDSATEAAGNASRTATGRGTAEIVSRHTSTGETASTGRGTRTRSGG